MSKDQVRFLCNSLSGGRGAVVRLSTSDCKIVGLIPTLLKHPCQDTKPHLAYSERLLPVFGSGVTISV